MLTATVKVEPLVKEFEDLNVDPSTGEILCGGNSHIFVDRTISPETQREIDDSVRARFGQDLKEWDITFQNERYKLMREKDYPPKPPPNW